MSEDRVAEVSLQAVKVPEIVKDTINGLAFIDFGGEKVKLYTITDIMREALMKGLSLMLLERKLYEELMAKQAKNGAELIQASLLKDAV